jgi:D-alanine-D-alanine ligase-like ATP-grasp enzyme
VEDRKEFEDLLEKLNIKRPKGMTVFTAQQAVEAARNLGYPVLVRPSYVLGGQGMEIAWDEDGIREYMRIIGRYKQEHPVLVDKYMTGMELEVDAISDGTDILIPGIMEHIERAGVHSGADAFSFHLDTDSCKKLSAGQYTYTIGYDHTDPKAKGARRRIRLTSITLKGREGYAKPIGKQRSADVSEAAKASETVEAVETLET